MAVKAVMVMPVETAVVMVDMVVRPETLGVSQMREAVGAEAVAAVAAAATAVVAAAAAAATAVAAVVAVQDSSPVNSNS